MSGSIEGDAVGSGTSGGVGHLDKTEIDSVTMPHLWVTDPSRLSGPDIGGEEQKVRETVQELQARSAKERSAERSSGLAGFVRSLKGAGVLDKDDQIEEFESRHMMQKYVYIAQKFGVPLGYEFAMIENGAFSTELALDIYDLCKNNVTDEHSGQSGNFAKFAEMVRGRGMKWLQIATFALDRLDDDEEREEFVEWVSHSRMRYDKQAIRHAYDSVHGNKDMVRDVG